MNTRIRPLWLSLLFLSLVIVGLGTYKAKAFKHQVTQIAPQSPDRLVSDKSRSDSPVKITLVKTKKRVVENNKNFHDDDDWLRGLTLRVVNRSDKTITYVGIQLIFRRTEDQESGLPAAWPLNYGFDPFGLNPEDSIPSPQIAPLIAGTDTEIMLSETEYNEVKGFLADAGFPLSLKRIELDIIKIGFSDGTAWNNGQIFRRDPSSVGGPLKGWTLLDDPGNSKRPHEPPSGSAQNRTAFFMKAAFRSYDRSESLFSKFFSTPTEVTQNVPCGNVFYESVTCSTAGAGLDCRNDQANLF